ncbi:MAG TPA: type II toxin-antitoxin system HicB family antitoxin [Chloroflexota bacterium]|nr:type II toxin-antitoxin system HicB family antitoxin [Chloroflexota bacterium]
MNGEQSEQHTYIEHYAGHTIVYDQGPTTWGAYVEDLPVCFSVGDTFEECQRRIKEAIPIYLEADRVHRQQADNATASRTP